jgi:hypothetical protein
MCCNYLVKGQGVNTLKFGTDTLALGSTEVLEDLLTVCRALSFANSAVSWNMVGSPSYKSLNNLYVCAMAIQGS